MLTDWFDPAITDETDPISVDPNLDMYNPANGPSYSAEFVQRYRQAQIARNHRITDWCHSELSRLESVGHRDRAFNLYGLGPICGCSMAVLTLPTALLVVVMQAIPKPPTTAPEALVSPTPCAPGCPCGAYEIPVAAVQNTWGELQNQLWSFKVMQIPGVFPSDAEAIFQQLASSDKALHMISGDHYLQDPNDARDVAADLIQDWLQAQL